MLPIPYYPPAPPPEKPATLTRRVWGLDLGKSVDYSALVEVEWAWPPPPPAPAFPGAGAPPGPRLVRYEATSVLRWPLGTAYLAVVADLARRLTAAGPFGPARPAPHLVIDETGVGAAVVEAVRQALGAARLPVPVAGVTITAGAAVSRPGPGRWRVAKHALASVLRRVVGTRRAHVSDCPLKPALLREMQTFVVKTTPAGNESFESWREGDHDDLVLSLALALWAAETMSFGSQGPPGPRRVRP